ncbi:hypothetical protein [Parvularcula marina]|uniref:Uncharacterized protein n=1 Tax=Parvularcula marina TaxID=2292771 RepID=A0A371RGS8_9PROT|nr:hypothetical protein [Parvularcula marina]RFB04657.1 hypothetical protein DX908_04815 [Parvularcula marina]
MMRGLVTTLLRLGGVAAMVWGMATTTGALISLASPAPEYMSNLYWMSIPTLTSALTLFGLGLGLFLGASWLAVKIVPDADEMSLELATLDVEKAGFVLLGAFFAAGALIDLTYWGHAVWGWLRSAASNHSAEPDAFYEYGVIVSCVIQLLIGLVFVWFGRRK